MEKAKLHVYTGEGKGKTTAAIGLALRAAGQGYKVGFFQFLKSGLSGEMVPLVKQGVQFFAPQGSGKFLWEMNQEEQQACRRQQTANFERACVMAEKFDLLVLDEVVCAVQAGMLSWPSVEAFIKHRPPGVELVMTGRGAGEEWVALADYVTEMKCVKHPYHSGLAARKGIEY